MMGQKLVGGKPLVSSSVDSGISQVYPVASHGSYAVSKAIGICGGGSKLSTIAEPTSSGVGDGGGHGGGHS